MIWYKINQRWWIDITQVRSFGMPKESPNTITIQWKDSKEDYFVGVENVEEEFAKLEEFIQQMFEPIKVIAPDDGELPFGMN